MTTWYYAREGQQHGPHTEEELRRFLAEGRLASSELIWKAGLPGWVPAASVFPPAAPAGGPPPVPSSGAGWSAQPPQQMQPAYAAAPPPYPGAQPPYANAPYAQPYAQPQRKERVAYILLGIFLGGLGIHNFYAGYTSRAVAQLLISLLTGWLVIPLIAVWIWVIVEVITVEADARGVPFS